MVNQGLAGLLKEYMLQFLLLKLKLNIIHATWNAVFAT